MSDHVVSVLDVVGLKCPLPVLKTRKALSQLAPGATLEVLASDPVSAQDLEALCATSGHVLVDQSEVAGVKRFLIRKAGGDA